MARWPLLIPLFAGSRAGRRDRGGCRAIVAVLCAVALIGTVFAAVHHAEVVAHRVGEPFGTLVLAVAVTVIEASLILALMLADAEKGSVIARDTIYAAVMIICNGVVGVCVLAGSLAHREQTFRVEGRGRGAVGADRAVDAVARAARLHDDHAGAAPTATRSSCSPPWRRSLWAVFVFIQTVRHRDYFLPVDDAADQTVHAEPPSNAPAWASFGLLLVSLVAVVGLAKMLSRPIEQACRGRRAAGRGRDRDRHAGAAARDVGGRAGRAREPPADQHEPRARLGAREHRPDDPRGAVAAIGFGLPLVLGLEPKDIVMLALTLLVSAVTLGTGRTHVMQGAVHLVLFAAFLFLALVP